jgi:hypothetical protein
VIKGNQSALRLSELIAVDNTGWTFACAQLTAGISPDGSWRYLDEAAWSFEVLTQLRP